MKSKAYSLFVVLSICCALRAISQSDKFVSRHYTMKDGLPTDGVNCVIQDHLGFIWLGTFSGITRFDGYDFITYRNNPASTNTLRNNYVRDMIEDTLGRLWIGQIVRNRIEERRKMRERFSREITLEPKQISITSMDEKFITKVLTVIDEHMQDDAFTVDDLSRKAGFSNMHFYRKIKALSGQTPSQFLRTIRLKRAAEMLSKNSDNVTQIAYSVGFSSLSYFNKCFKERFGITPGQYAERKSLSPNTK